MCVCVCVCFVGVCGVCVAGDLGMCTQAQGLALRGCATQDLTALSREGGGGSRVVCVCVCAGGCCLVGVWCCVFVD